VTTLGFAERWRFKGVDLASYAVLVQRTDGVDELPPLRGENILVPSIGGRRHAGKLFDERRLTLALFVNSLNASGAMDPGTPTAWAATHAYLLGVRVMGSGGGATHSYEVTVAGTSAGSEPTWPTTGGTVTDGGVTWTDRGVYSATPLTNTRQARANLDALYAIFGDRTPGALVRVMPDASERTATAEVVAVGDINDTFGGEALGIVVDFLLADPLFYGAAVSPSEATASSPTNFNLTNAGSVSTHRPVLTFTGPISNPRLINLTIDSGAGFYVECLVTVASGELLVIDCGAWTATNNGVNAIGSIRHSGAFEFFRLVPGVNSLRVTSTSPGGSLAIAYAPSFL